MHRINRKSKLQNKTARVKSIPVMIQATNPFFTSARITNKCSIPLHAYLLIITFAYQQIKTVNFLKPLITPGISLNKTRRIEHVFE